MPEAHTVQPVRDKLPDDAAVKSALTDLQPYTLIAAEQSLAREDFPEAQRLVALIEKVADGEYVRAAGEHLRRGTRLLSAGDILGDRGIGLLAGAGVDKFVEVGAGKVLSGLIRRIAPGEGVIDFGKPTDIADVKALLGLA